MKTATIAHQAVGPVPMPRFNVANTRNRARHCKKAYRNRITGLSPAFRSVPVKCIKAMTSIRAITPMINESRITRRIATAANGGPCDALGQLRGVPCLQCARRSADPLSLRSSRHSMVAAQRAGRIVATGGSSRTGLHGPVGTRDRLCHVRSGRRRGCERQVFGGNRRLCGRNYVLDRRHQGRWHQRRRDLRSGARCGPDLPMMAHATDRMGRSGLRPR